MPSSYPGTEAIGHTPDEPLDERWSRGLSIVQVVLARPFTQSHGIEVRFQHVGPTLGARVLNRKSQLRDVVAEIVSWERLPPATDCVGQFSNTNALVLLPLLMFPKPVTPRFDVPPRPVGIDNPVRSRGRIPHQLELPSTDTEESLDEGIVSHCGHSTSRQRELGEAFQVDWAPVVAVGVCNEHPFIADDPEAVIIGGTNRTSEAVDNAAMEVQARHGKIRRVGGGGSK